MIFGKFIGGNNIINSMKISKSWPRNKYPIFDYAKEGAVNLCDIDMYEKQVRDDLILLSYYNKNAFYALKVSSFCTDHIHAISTFNRILSVAYLCDIKILMDAENNALKAIEQYFIDNIHITLPVEEKINYTNYFKTYQMYRKDALNELNNDIKNGTVHNFKLVRGAYMHIDKPLGVLLPTKQDVDDSYNTGVDIVLKTMLKKDTVSLMIATHNAKSTHKALTFLQQNPNLIQRVYFAQLLGMADQLTTKLTDTGMNVCKYIPYGSMRETYPYLVRRLYENYDVLKYLTR